MPHRTHSRVIKANDKWFKQSVLVKKGDYNDTRFTTRTHGKAPRSPCLNFSHIYLRGRHSCPLYRSKLATVVEEDS